MKPVFQTRTGSQGNCLPACIASLLEISIDETDRFSAQHADWKECMDSFLAARGLFYIEFDFRKPNVCTALPHGALVIVGAHEGREIAHAVVARVESDGATGYQVILEHDPSPIPVQNFTPDSLILLCKLDTIT